MDDFQAQALLGEVVEGKYEVTRLVGAGAMGAVYEAVHALIGHRVAIKVLREELAGSPDMMTRFLQEARVAGSLGHANICEVTDLGVLPSGAPYLVMPLLAGRSLRQELEVVGGALPFPRVFDIVYQVLTAVQRAHDERIVHRDLKPDNIFLTKVAERSDFVKVLDFGISKVLPTPGTATGHLTSTGMVLGTPFYMAPEQASGSRDVDHRADIYAVGVILFELLTGTRPFTGSSYNEIIIKIVTADFPSPRAVSPLVPVGIEGVLLRAVARDPAARYPSARDFKHALLAEARLVRLPLPHYLQHPDVTGEITLLDESDLGSAAGDGATLHAAVAPSPTLRKGPPPGVGGGPPRVGQVETVAFGSHGAGSAAGFGASALRGSAAPGTGGLAFPDGALELAPLDGGALELGPLDGGALELASLDDEAPPPAASRVSRPSLGNAGGGPGPGAGAPGGGSPPSGGPPRPYEDPAPLELDLSRAPAPSGTMASPPAPARDGEAGAASSGNVYDGHAEPLGAAAPPGSRPAGLPTDPAAWMRSPPPPEEEPDGRRRLLLLGGVLGGAVALAGLYYGMGWHKDKPSKRPPRRDEDEDGLDDVPSGGRRGPLPADLPRQEVQIVFQVEPRHAKLLVRGREAPGHSLLMPLSEKALVVRFVAKGYAPEEVRVVPDQNRTLLVHLTPLK